MKRRVIEPEEKLSILKTVPLSLQHLFAMFSATVVIPVLFHINPSTVLFFNGLGTIFYLIICKGKVPAYLGSSMAFISPVFIVFSRYNYEYALGGFVAVGGILCIIGFLIKLIGTKWIDFLFPPAAMGAIVSVIGLELLPFAAKMAGFTGINTNIKVILVSMLTLTIAIFSMVIFKGFLSLISILFSIICGYIIAYLLGMVDLSTVKTATWFSLPTFYKIRFSFDAISVILPVSFVIIAEHIGHFIVTGNIMERNIMKDPGLARSFLGNGFSTIVSGCFGSTPNTTYGENIGVLAITKVFSTWVIGYAAVFAIILSFVGKLSALIQSIPTAVMGGISLVLFGVIAVSGIRILIEKKVNYNEPKNLAITSAVLGIGVSSISVTISSVVLKGMTLATVVAMILSISFNIVEYIYKYFNKNKRHITTIYNI